MFAANLSNAKLSIAACLTGVLGFAIAMMGYCQERDIKGPVAVKIQDDKTVVVDAVAPLDMENQVQLRGVGNMFVQIRADNQMLHQNYLQTLLQIDGQIRYPGNPPGRLVTVNQPLPQGKSKKNRNGFVSVYQINNMTITQEVEVVPSKAK